jgi:hypothetical protein
VRLHSSQEISATEAEGQNGGVMPPLQDEGVFLANGADEEGFLASLEMTVWGWEAAG